MERMESLRKNQMRFIWILIAAAYAIVWILPFLIQHTGQAFGSAENHSNLRDTSNFSWYIIALVGAVSYAYSLEVEKKNWAGIFAALAFFLMDAFNELWNGLIFTATEGYSAYWMCGYPTGYQPLIGWTIEIIFCFLFFGLCVTKGLPKDKNAVFFGFLNNRIVIAFVWATVGVIVEIILNSFNALIWNYWWWSARFPFFLLLLAYLPFTMIAYYVYDLPSVREQRRFVGIMAGILAFCYAIFIPLGWT